MSDDEPLFERTRSGTPLGSKKARGSEGNDDVQGLLETERYNPASPWVAYVDESSGAQYYHNTVTDETSWNMPADGVARVGDDDASSRSDASDLSERSSVEEDGGELVVLVHTVGSRTARHVELESGMTMDCILDECCVETGHVREGAKLLLGDLEVLSYTDLHQAARRDRHGTLQCSAELVTGTHGRRRQQSPGGAKSRPSASVRDALGSGDLRGHTARESRRAQQDQNNEGRNAKRLLPATQPLPPPSASPYSRGQPGRGPYLRQPAVRPLAPPGRPRPPMESFAEIVKAAARAKREAATRPGSLDERKGLPKGTILDVEGCGRGGVVVGFHQNKFSANEHSVDFGGKVVKLNLVKETWSISAPKVSQQEQLESEPGFKYEVRTEFVEAGRTGFELEENSAGMTIVRRVRPQSKAAAVPHVCEGMTLLRVQAGRGVEVSTDGMSHDSVMDMMPDRPLVLIWAHPWQRQLDDAGYPYYFNSLTEASRRDKPQELAGVMSAMMDWKYPRLPNVSAPRVVSCDHLLDEAAAGFSYEVQLTFTQPGRLGLEFKDYEGSALVTKIQSGSLAAAMPHACAGMVVARVKVDMQTEQATTGLGFDGVMDLVSTKDRPLCITFTHPWQREKTDEGDVYYFNSATSESSWERPGVLDKVVASMQAWPQKAPSSLRKIESPKPSAPKLADIESAPGFRYELRTYTNKTPYEKSGLLGFKYKENEDGAAVVRKITRMTPAASLANGCEGMVLVRVKAGTAGEMDVCSLDFQSTLELLEQRPLRLTFEHPWQKAQDDSDRSYYFNSWTGESRWDRPAELGPVVEAMREWYGTEEESESPSPQPSAGTQQTVQLEEETEISVFEVRAEFTRRGRLGFEFDEVNKRVRVKNVNGGTPASSQPLLCVGMFLSRIRCGDQTSELSVDHLGFDHVMDMMPERPLVLIFEYPWQRIADGAEPYYFNSWTEESRWDRPPELDAVVAAMKTWKQQLQTPAPQQQQPPTLALAPAPDSNLDAVANEGPQARESRSDIDSDESVPGFVYQVQLSFAQQGALGFDLQENRDGQVYVKKVRKGTAAAAEALSCSGLVLLRVKSGRLNAEKDVSDGSVPLDDIMDMMADRPLTLTFAHPWQVVDDGAGKCYFNSYTKKSVRERPAVLDSVMEAMRTWQPQMLGSSATRVVRNGQAGSTAVEMSMSAAPGEQAVASGSVAVEKFGQIDSDLPPIGLSLEVYSVGEGKWYLGRVIEHVGKTSQPGSSAFDIRVEYKFGTKQKILSWRDSSAIRSLESSTAAGTVETTSASPPALRLEAASPSPTRMARTQTTDGIECEVLATNDKGSLMTYTEYMIQTSWAGRVKVVEKRFRDIDALVCKIRFLLPNSGLRALPPKTTRKSAKQIAERKEFIAEYIPAAIRFVTSDAQEGKRLEARQYLKWWLEM